MDAENMPCRELKPTIIVFAGPNGSGKSTITKLATIIPPYINADEIKQTTQCSDLEAAEKAELLREKLIKENKSFTFETVLSTDRNLKLLQQAKKAGYFIKCIYVLTEDPKINVIRVKSRFASGGHDVPPEKIVSRYYKALALIPELIKCCDIFHLYDNTTTPFRIFKKRKTEYFCCENAFWNTDKIKSLTSIIDVISKDLN